jgi:hypothetical protein
MLVDYADSVRGIVYPSHAQPLRHLRHHSRPGVWWPDQASFRLVAAALPRSMATS